MSQRPHGSSLQSAARAMPALAEVVWRVRAERRLVEDTALGQMAGARAPVEPPWERAAAEVRRAFPSLPEPLRTAAALLHWMGPPERHGPATAAVAEDFLRAAQSLPRTRPLEEELAWAALAYGCGWQRAPAGEDGWAGVWAESEAEFTRMASRLVLRSLRLLQGCVPAFHLVFDASHGRVDRARLYWLSTLAVQLFTGSRPLLPGGHCTQHHALREWRPAVTNLPGCLLGALTGHPASRRSRNAGPSLKAWACRSSLILEVLRVENSPPDDPGCAPAPRLTYSEQTAVRECTACGRAAPRPMLAPDAPGQGCPVCGGTDFFTTIQKRLFLPELAGQRPYVLLCGSKPARYVPVESTRRLPEGRWSQRPSLLWVRTGPQPASSPPHPADIIPEDDSWQEEDSTLYSGMSFLPAGFHSP